MTDTPEENTPLTDAEIEFEALKDKARLLGVAFRDNIKPESLADRVKKHIEEMDKVAAESTAPDAPEVTTPETPKKDVIPETVRLRRQQKRDLLKLIRVRITCHDSSKSAWEGKPFSGGNDIIPSITRYIPFGREWHCEQILLNIIKEERYTMRTSKKVNGKLVTTAQTVPTYNVEILPPLTEKEIKQLAVQQAAKSGEVS